MNNEKAVAEKLLQINAIKLSPDKPFAWASGWKSPIYCDNRKILSFPLIREFIKDGMCSLVATTYPNANLLAGVATAGIPWGAMAADKLKLTFIYVRTKTQEHGLGNHIEGFYERGMQTVVIEDLISTGKSSLQAADILKNAGLQLAGMISIFTYGFKAADEAFKEANVQYKSLTNYSTLIKLAIENGIISSDDEKTLLKWREDPANWKQS